MAWCLSINGQSTLVMGDDGSGGRRREGVRRPEEWRCKAAKKWHAVPSECISKSGDGYADMSRGDK